MRAEAQVVSALDPGGPWHQVKKCEAFLQAGKPAAQEAEQASSLYQAGASESSWMGLGSGAVL